MKTMIIQPWGMDKHESLKTYMKEIFIELFKQELIILHWGGNDEEELKDYARETLKIKFEDVDFKLQFIDVQELFMVNLGADKNSKKRNAKDRLIPPSLQKVAKVFLKTILSKFF